MGKVVRQGFFWFFCTATFVVGGCAHRPGGDSVPDKPAATQDGTHHGPSPGVSIGIGIGSWGGHRGVGAGVGMGW